MSTARYLVRRAIITVFLIFGVATLLFFVFRLMPGDYATILVGEGASPEQVEEIRREWGLHEPLYVQYYHYIENLVTGDLGTSRRLNEPVWDAVSTSLANSFILVFPAIITAYVLGSIYGGLMGSKPGSLLEKYGIIPPTIFGTAPGFFIGILLIVLFASVLGLFPVGSMATLDTYREAESHLDIYLTADFLHHYALPFLTITLRFLYYPSLIMRSSVVEMRNQPFIEYQHLVGLEKVTRLKHTMKHASLPVITTFPIITATSLSGMVTIEIVFNWPGIGKLLLDSVVARDVPVVQFIFLLIAVWIILGNFLVDIYYSIVDPRITLGGE